MGRWQETVCPPCDRWIASRGPAREVYGRGPTPRSPGTICWGLDLLGRSSRSWGGRRGGRR
eukprot:5911642-Prymnesium_polylepis.1